MPLRQFLLKMIRVTLEFALKRITEITSALKNLEFPALHLFLLSIGAAVFITTAFSLVSDENRSQMDVTFFETQQIELPTASPNLNETYSAKSKL